MAKADFSLSISIETDDDTMLVIDQYLNKQQQKQLCGRIKDMLAQELGDSEFDLSTRYYLFSIEPEKKADNKKPSPNVVPIWSSEEEKFISIEVGSADWFAQVATLKKFKYKYKGLTFNVKWETRTVKGNAYSYWRAYCTVKKHLWTKQIGKTEDLTKATLDKVGHYFLSKKTP